jgi:hypothetical protein
MNAPVRTEAFQQRGGCQKGVHEARDEGDEGQHPQGEQGMGETRQIVHPGGRQRHAEHRPGDRHTERDYEFPSNGQVEAPVSAGGLEDRPLVHNRRFVETGKIVLHRRTSAFSQRNKGPALVEWVAGLFDQSLCTQHLDPA